MAEPRVALIFAFRVTSGLFLSAISAAAGFVPAVQAQQTQSQPVAGVVVTGEGSVSVRPDYAQIGSGVITRANTVKEATDANSKLMSAVINALLESGIAQKDIQTSRFSIQPVYAQQEPRTEPKLAGYSVSNQVKVKIRQIDRVGEILDHLITAGATNIGNIEFLASEPSKALDQAREAAVADARRKAEVYANASGLHLGRVAWITEDSGTPSIPMRAPAASAAAVPIATGEDTLRVRITVGFEIALIAVETIDRTLGSRRARILPLARGGALRRRRRHPRSGCFGRSAIRPEFQSAVLLPRRSRTANR